MQSNGENQYPVLTPNTSLGAREKKHRRVPLLGQQSDNQIRFLHLMLKVKIFFTKLLTVLFGSEDHRLRNAYSFAYSFVYCSWDRKVFSEEQNPLTEVYQSKLARQTTNLQ